MQTSRTVTSTDSYARHISAKVASDLKRLQRLYGVGQPTDKEINDYQEEMRILLYYEYLHAVTYGFRRDDKWIVALKYQAIGDQLHNDGDDPGGITPGQNIRGTRFTSFLAYSTNWFCLSEGRRREHENEIPVRRVEGIEPSIDGIWTEDKRYVAGGLGVQRTMLEKH